MINFETLPDMTTSMTPVSIEAEPLLDIQLLVARRADVLARRHLPATREVDRRVWLRAELEIFDRTDGKYT